MPLQEEVDNQNEKESQRKLKEEEQTAHNLLLQSLSPRDESGNDANGVITSAKNNFMINQKSASQ